LRAEPYRRVIVLDEGASGLADFLKPNLKPPERAVAEVDGWILGVPVSVRA
jgi:hypothetical protein